MTDVSSNDNGCPNCGAPGRRSMVVPFGSIHAREGVRFRCGRTEPEERLASPSCDYAAALRTQLAERDDMIRELAMELRYIESTAFAGEASPNDRDFQRIMQSSRKALARVDALTGGER